MKNVQDKSLLKANLLHLKERGNLTAATLEKICGVGRSNWSNWVDQKKEQTPSKANLMKLASFFRVSVSELTDTDLTKRSDLPVAMEPETIYGKPTNYGQRLNVHWGAWLNATDSIKFRPEHKDLTLAKSERFLLPSSFGLSAEHLMFKYFGESCTPTLTADDQLIAILASDAEEATLAKICIVPTNTKVLFGKVSLVDEKTIKVTPLNTAYKATNVPISECPYIYRVLGRVQFSTGAFI